MFNILIEFGIPMKLLCYAIKRIQVNKDGMKLNGAHHFLVYADDVIMLGGTVNTMKEKAEALIMARKETGVEINADKTKYIIMSRDQNAGQSHNMKTDNRSLESAEKFKYLGTTLTNQNSIQEEITSGLMSENASNFRCKIFCLPVCNPQI